MSLTASSDNPYAPPETATPGELPSAPHPFGWKIEKYQLWIKSSAQLPMIDLLSGTDNETMLLRLVKIRHRPWWLFWGPLVIWLAYSSVIAVRTSALAFVEVSAEIFVTLLLCWPASLLLGIIKSTCTLKFFITRKTLQTIRIYGWSMKIVFLCFFLGMFFLPKDHPQLAFLPLAALALYALGAIAGFWIRRRLRCRRKAGDWFEIRGIHPRALEHLTKMQSQADR